MNLDRWRRIEDLRNAARKLEPEQRRAFLADACTGDEELRCEIDSLVDWPDATTIAPLNSPDWQATTSGERLRPTGSLPTSIGRYRIVCLLGEGGMGVVYEAEQQQPRRTVALKVIKLGLTSLDPVRRFEQETRALGRLQHPGIAQIYEAGMADTGFGPQRYFAMEFIRGRSLCEYAAGLNLNLRQRLQLIIKICEAVHHAHQRAVIHRDLKPGNILVDETGQPKILDFGVAIATDRDTQVTRQTDLGQLVGTLAYMSPEQVLGDPLAIDARSDVYALGVILYELLAGRMPYQISHKLHEAVQTIREEEPAWLSSIGRQYRGDVETIVAKALEKDKARRYASAADLAADIQHYLRDEPIVARPASAAYQFRKFARRHKAVVSGAGAVFVVLTAGIVASTWQAARATQAQQAALLERDRATAAEQKAARERDRATAAEQVATTQRDRALFAEQAAKAAEARALHERNRAVAEKKRADTESATAIAVNDFLRNDLLAQAGATAQAGLGSKPIRDLTVRIALDRAAKRIEGKFPSEPLVEASIRQTIGATYLDLGLSTEAQRELERAVDVRRRLLGERHKDTLESLNWLANVLQEQGKYAQAEAIRANILEVQQRVVGEEHPDTLSSMNHLASVYRSEGKNDKASELAAKTLDIQRRLLGEEHPDTLSTMINIAEIKRNQGAFAQAEALFSKVMEVRRRVLGEEHPDTLLSMDQLALQYRSQGKYQQAEKLCAQTLEIRRRVLGEEHPATLETMTGLGVLYRLDGNYARAEELLGRALEIGRRALGEEHPVTLIAMNELPGVYWVESRFSEAEPLYVKVLEIQRRLLGDEHQETLSIMNNLALVYLSDGKYAQAEPLLIKVLELRRRVLGEEHPDALRSMNNLAVAYLSEGKYAQAEPLYEKVRETQSRTLGEEHPDTLLSTNNLATLYRNQGKYDQAETFYMRALEGRRRTLGEQNPDTLVSMNDLASMFEGKGDCERAQALFGKVLELRRHVLGQEHPVTLNTLTSLGRVLLKQQKYAEAEPLLREALVGMAKRSPDAWARFNSQSLLGETLAGQRKYSEAELLLLSGYNGLLERESRIPFSLRPALEQAGERVVQLYRDWGMPEKAAAWRERLQVTAADPRKP
jgi:non-specific serine/threonine protein kinase/serine/threonine-protein kinase